MRAAILFLATLFMTGPAAASGGFSCRAEDESASISLHGGVTRGMGSPVFSLRGGIETRGGEVAGDLRNTRFERTHLAQYWLDGSQLRLVLYRERDGGKPHGYAELTVTTTAQEDGAFAGSYRLEMFDMTGATSGEGRTARFEGEIICSVE